MRNLKLSLGVATILVVAGTNAMAAVPSKARVAPGASLQCQSSGKNAWLTYGEKGFLAVNNSIFANVDKEIKANGTKNLGDSFLKVGSGTPAATSDSAASFKNHLGAFLIWAYGGPRQISAMDGKSYRGPQDMKKEHEGLNITSAQYDYFVTSIIVPALKENGVPDKDISSCFAPPLLDPAFKASIVAQPKVAATFTDANISCTTTLIHLDGSFDCNEPLYNAQMSNGRNSVTLNHLFATSGTAATLHAQGEGVCALLGYSSLVHQRFDRNSAVEPDNTPSIRAGGPYIRLNERGEVVALKELDLGILESVTCL